MVYTGSARFTVHVQVQGEDTEQGLAESHEKVDELMRRFLAMAEEEGVTVTNVIAPALVCY